MAHYTEAHVTGFSLIDWANERLNALRATIRQNREINRTYNELAALSDRDLNDLGIGRSDISRIARESVLG
jgi:uncharacterized protein YjiS (DUF1127 family)